MRKPMVYAWLEKKGSVLFKKTNVHLRGVRPRVGEREGPAKNKVPFTICNGVGVLLPQY